MSCFICGKYQGDRPVQPIAELEGIALTHIAPSDDGWAMKGRLIIEPIRHVENPEDLMPQEFSNMGILLQRAMNVLKAHLGAEHVYFFRINEQVKHFHFHVLPRYAGTPKEFWGLKIVDWPDYPKIDDNGVQELSSAVRSKI